MFPDSRYRVVGVKCGFTFRHRSSELSGSLVVGYGPYSERDLRSGSRHRPVTDVSGLVYGVSVPSRGPRDTLERGSGVPGDPFLCGDDGSDEVRDTVVPVESPLTISKGRGRDYSIRLYYDLVTIFCPGI